MPLSHNDTTMTAGNPISQSATMDEDDGAGLELRPLVPPPSPRGLLGPHIPIDLHPRRSKTTRKSLAVDGKDGHQDVSDQPHQPHHAQTDSFDDEDALLPSSSPGKDAKPTHSHGHGHGHGSGGAATPRQTVINIFISFVGAGMLGMPYAFSRSGAALGVLCLGLVSTANVYCMLLLVKTRRRLEREGHTSIEGYGDVGRIVLGERGERLVNVSLVISQVGFATAYIIFIASNATSILPDVGRAVICYGCVPILSVLVQIKDMAILSPFSLLADVANLAGTTAVFLQDFKAFQHHEEIKYYDWSSFLYVTAVSVYSLEGVGMVLPLESSCVKREDFPKLLKGSVVGITLLIATFGVCGYAAFGSHVQAPVTLNLDGGVASFVKLALCLALYLTYPVMFFPVWLVAPLSGPLRFLSVLGTAVVAHGVPSFGKFLGLVGASICTLLGFIIPCWFHIKVFHYDAKRKVVGGESGLKRWELGVDIFLIAFGVVFGILGTIDSAKSLIYHTESAGHR